MDLMADAVAAGKIKAVGVSNYSAERSGSRTQRWRGGGSRWPQTKSSIRSCTASPKRTACSTHVREFGVTLITYQPLAGRTLTGKYKVGDRPTGLRRFMPYFRRAGLERR